MQPFVFLAFLALAAAEGPQVSVVVRIARKIQRKRQPENYNDPIIVAETNSRFHPMTCWFLDALEDVGVERPLLVALDSAEYDRLKKQHVPVARYEGVEMDYKQTSFRTPQYNQVVNHKWRVVYDLLTNGFDVLLTDVDVHWKRNPLPYFKTLPQCDLYIGTNSDKLPRYPNGTIRIYPPFPGDGYENEFNTGFYLARSNPRMIDLAKTVLSKLSENTDDQYHFNALLNSRYHANKAVSSLSHTAKTCANYGNLTFHILRVDLFPLWAQYKVFPIREDYITMHYNYMLDYATKWDVMIKSGAVHRGYRYILPE